MTTLNIHFDDRDWTLTDEASQCSYGEPVLVSHAGEAFRAIETAIPEGRFDFFGIPIPPVPAYAIVCHGTRNDGEEISVEEWPAIEAMLDRYAAQWRQFGPPNINGLAP